MKNSGKILWKWENLCGKGFLIIAVSANLLISITEVLSYKMSRDMFISLFDCFYFTVFRLIVLFFKLWLISYFKNNINTGEKSNSKSQRLETLKYNLDVNFFNVNFQNFNMPYLWHTISFRHAISRHAWKMPWLPSQYITQIFPHSIFKYQEHQKNAENFKLFLTSINFNFSVVYFSETWLDD